MTETGSELPLDTRLELLRQHHADSSDPDDFDFDAALTIRGAIYEIGRLRLEVHRVRVETDRMRKSIQAAYEDGLSDGYSDCGDTAGADDHAIRWMTSHTRLRLEGDQP